MRRDLGWSLARIARELGVAKSSVSVWVRSVQPPAPVSPAPRPPDAMPVRRLRVWKSGALRRCSRCGHDLPIECFNRHRDGLQWWCRSCFAAYFRERGDTHRRQSYAAKLARQRALRAQVLDHLRQHPCVDCGEARSDRPRVRPPRREDGEHLRTDLPAPRRARPSTPRSPDARWSARTATGGEPRSRGRLAPCLDSESGLGRTRPRPSNGTSRTSTTSCGAVRAPTAGSRIPLVLEFDHIGLKRDAVTRLAWYGCSLATIDAEIARVRDTLRELPPARDGEPRRTISASAS